MKHIAERVVSGKKIRVVQGDITERDTDAVVNAANSYLQHGGGVAGAIVRKGGKTIQDESDKIGFVPVGNAAITGAGTLPARYVIHAVGPRMGEGDEEHKLRNAMRSILHISMEKGIKSISVPAISAGIFGFPKDKCAIILVTESVDFLRENPETSLHEIEFCLFDETTAEYFRKELERLT